MWDFDIYQHPDRLQGESAPRYISTYDVYSLGVVLLEVGLWKPLEDVADDLELDLVDRSNWPGELLKAAEGLFVMVGQRYCRLVK